MSDGGAIIEQDFYSRFYQLWRDGASLTSLSFIEKDNYFDVALGGVLQGSGNSLVSEQIRLNVNAMRGGINGPHDHSLAVVAGGEGEAHLTADFWLFPVSSLSGTVRWRSR
jgi:hypothetical protein